MFQGTLRSYGQECKLAKYEFLIDVGGGGGGGGVLGKEWDRMRRE